MVLPGQAQAIGEEPFSGYFVRPARDLAEIRDRAPTGGAGPVVTVLTLAGCVTYQRNGSGVLYRTGFAFHVSAADADDGWGGITVDPNIPERIETGPLRVRRALYELPAD